MAAHYGTSLNLCQELMSLLGLGCVNSEAASLTRYAHHSLYPDRETLTR